MPRRHRRVMSVHDQRSSDGDEDARANRDKQLQAAVALDAQFCKVRFECHSSPRNCSYTILQVLGGNCFEACRLGFEPAIDCP